MTYVRPRNALSSMLAQIASAACRPEAERHTATAEVIGAFAAQPGLLAGQEVRCCPERYARHLLHADPAGGYAVVALVWRPGQMSPVHAHKTWCAFAIHAGILTETLYTPGHPPAPTATRLLHPGMSGHGAARPDLIHRLANLSCATAVSIHCYGAAFDRFGMDVNEVHAH